MRRAQVFSECPSRFSAGLVKILVHLGFSALALNAWGARFGYDSSLCSGKYDCGSERNIGVDDRVAPSFSQPLPESVPVGNCGDLIPANQALRAKIHPVTCGEGSEVRDRYPIAVDKRTMSQWDKLLRSTVSNNREEAQQLRTADLKWATEIAFPVYENWTYDQIHGGFNGDRCGYEPWETTCERSRTEEYTYEEEVCASRETAPAYDGGGSSSGGGYQPVESPYKTRLNDTPSGHSESYQEQKGRGMQYYDDEASRSNLSPIDVILGVNRAVAAAGDCIQWKTVTRTSTRSVEPIRYKCMKQRPKFCTWFEKESVRRSCRPHKATVNVEYERDSNWRPGYGNPETRTRDYVDILPNKWDLLPGETETVVTYANLGTSTTLRPAMAFSAGADPIPWNEYEAVASPAQVRCEYGMVPHINFKVITKGRNKKNAPNPLALPVQENGQPAEALEFGQFGGKPVRAFLQDKSRATMLAASMHSRSFPRPEGAPELAKDSMVTRAKVTQTIGDTDSNGFWVDTQFRLQLYKKDKWNRWVKLTMPDKRTTRALGVKIFRDSVEVGLNATNGGEDFDRATGPLNGVLGPFWRAIGTHLTPGHKYFIKLQVTQRGLPFYNGGCKDGKSTCEGEEQADEKQWSEPLWIDWTAPENVDNRTFLQRWKDLQEKTLIF